MLKNTALAQRSPDLEQLAKLAHQLEAPPKELKLLVNIYEQLAKAPQMTTGQLVNQFENTNVQQYLLDLSSQEDVIDPSLQEVELQDAIRLSIKWCMNSQIEGLIELGKTRTLTEEEKGLLHYLLISSSRSGIQSSQD